MSYIVGTPEWLAERRTYLGASEMAAALGLSPWDDPISVWESKTDPNYAPKPESFRMKLGTLIEPIISTLFAEQLAGEMTDSGYKAPRLIRMPGPKRHPSASFLASNPDFRIIGTTQRTGRGLVQAKLRLDEPFGEIDDGEGHGIPLHYRIQGLGELMTTGFDYVYFAALNPREGLRAYPLDRRLGDNEDAITDLFSDTKEWWESYVIPMRMPPPSAGSDAALLRHFPKAIAQVGKVASAEQELVLTSYIETKERAKAIDHEIDELKALIKSLIGDAAWIEGAGKRFTWARFETTKIDWPLIAAAYRKAIEEAWDDREMPEVDLDAVESLYTRTEASDRLTVGEIK